MAVSPAVYLARTFVRSYSHRGPRSPYSRLGEAGIMAYLSCAFVLPFVGPWRETQRAKKDGSYSTRPPLDLRYCPSLKV